jgi:4-hydroxybenzoate polyprenyltransferase
MTSSGDITSFDKGIWRYLPPLCRDILILMRMDRPIGWWLLVLPAWIVMPVAARLYDLAMWELFRLMGLFLVGAIIMRGTGCIVNDLWDRDIDPHVTRTSGRPIAVKRISIGLALLIIFLLALIGLVILIQLPIEAIVIGIAALPLIVAYPLAKRFTGYPQIILGITYSWGALLGWAAIGVWPDSRVIWLYLAMACWTFGYDTIYAIQDMTDDERIGIGSSALSLAGNIQKITAVVYGLVIALLIGFAVTTGAGPFFSFAIVVTAYHFGWQVARIDEHNPNLAGRLFRSNRNVGLILAAGTLADTIQALGWITIS